MATKIVGSIASKNLGSPSRAVALMEPHETVKELGIIRGVATAMLYGEDAKGNAYRGLKGLFVAESNDPAIGDYKAGKAFLMDAITEQMEMAFKDAEENGVVGFQIAFVFRVSVMEASNPIGYSWSYEAVGEVEGSSPLDHLPNPNRAPGATPALAAPSGDQTGKVTQNDATGEPKAVAKDKRAK